MERGRSTERIEPVVDFRLPLRSGTLAPSRGIGQPASRERWLSDRARAGQILDRQVNFAFVALLIVAVLGWVASAAIMVDL